MAFRRKIVTLILILLALQLAACQTEVTSSQTATATFPTPPSPSSSPVSTAIPTPTAQVLQTPSTPPQPTLTKVTPSPTASDQPETELAASSETPSLKLIGHLGGRLSAIAAQGDTLYLGIGSELALLDVSLSADRLLWPNLADQIPRLGYVVLPNLVTAVAVDGDIAYVMIEDHGLHAIDVSSPTAPVDLGQLDIPRPTGSLAVKEQVAYVALKEGGVGVYDVSDPTAPIERSRLDAAPGRIVATGDYLHLPTTSGVTVWDISDPVQPLAIGAYDLPGPLQAVAIRDDIAYVADTAALRIFDISDPAQFTELSFYATSLYMDIIYNSPGTGPGCQTTALAVEGNYAYINGCDGNQIIDISNPVQPTKAGSLADVRGSMALAMTGHGYVLGQGRLHVIDLSQPSAPQEIAAYRTSTWSMDEIVATEYHAYVVTPNGDLQIIDISNPAIPMLLDTYPLTSPEPAPQMAGQGNDLYVIDSERLRVIHLSSPIEPVEVGTLNLPKKEAGDPYEFTDVTVAGDYLYGVSRLREAILWIVDISDPTKPVEVNGADLLPHGAEDIVVADNYAIINASDGMKIIDVSDPAVPVQVGRYVDEAELIWSDLAVAGNYAYLGARHPHDLHIIDISEPTTPVAVGRYTPPGDGRAVAVSGSFAYVLDEYRSVLKMVDVSDPANPVKVAFYDVPNPSGFGLVTVVNGYIYADLGLAGLYILQPAFPIAAAPGNPHTYTDPDLGFSLSYLPSWILEARDGTKLNDGSGRTIQLIREDYLLAITAQFKPKNPGGCGGLFHQDNDSTDDYRQYQADGVELWRPQLENGFTNGYSDGALTFAGIISPAPNRSSYVCALEIDNRLFTINYRLPVSLEAIQAGQHRADILAEMDRILQSIVW